MLPSQRFGGIGGTRTHVGGLVEELSAHLRSCYRPSQKSAQLDRKAVIDILRLLGYLHNDILGIWMLLMTGCMNAKDFLSLMESSELVLWALDK